MARVRARVMPAYAQTRTGFFALYAARVGQSPQEKSNFLGLPKNCKVTVRENRTVALFNAGEAWYNEIGLPRTRTHLRV